MEQSVGNDYTDSYEAASYTQPIIQGLMNPGE